MIYKGDAVFKQVKQTYKYSLETLIDTPERHTSSQRNNETKAAYISGPGLYQLIFSLRLKLAEKNSSCYFMHCSVLHENFREDELTNMGKRGFVARRCVKY